MARIIAERSDALPILAELFREHGYEGTSLSLITEATGLGKGSLYHFFPGGKAEMATAVLEEIAAWFEAKIFVPLRLADPPQETIADMFAEVETYFRSGRRVCLIGVLAISDSRDRFAEAIQGYFASWVKAVAVALVRAGYEEPRAVALAEETVAGIQGAIVLARALGDTGTFSRIMVKLRAGLEMK